MSWLVVLGLVGAGCLLYRSTRRSRALPQETVAPEGAAIWGYGEDDVRFAARSAEPSRPAFGVRGGVEPESGVVDAVPAVDDRAVTDLSLVQGAETSRASSAVTPGPTGDVDLAADAVREAPGARERPAFPPPAKTLPVRIHDYQPGESVIIKYTPTDPDGPVPRLSAHQSGQDVEIRLAGRPVVILENLSAPALTDTGLLRLEREEPLARLH